MTRRLARDACAAAVCIVLIAVFLWRTETTRYEPLTAPDTPTSLDSLPQDSIVLEAHSAEVAAPFVVDTLDADTDGNVLALPQSSGSEDNSGRATLSFATAKPGDCTLWVRALWRDSCSNSLALSLDDSPDRTVGQNAVYNTWHWVAAGRYTLPAGEHTLTVKEREDGIAVSQLLLCTDPDFVPRGPIRRSRQAPGIRRFADQFSRSPGHGSEDWTFRGGEWDIEFSLDPNRIPNQYALVGSNNTPDGGAAEAAIHGQPWAGCRLAVSVFAPAAAQFGVVLGRSKARGSGIHVSLTVDEERAALGTAAPGCDIRTAGLGSTRLRQWHRLEVEHWAWLLRVRIDGRTVCERLDVPPHEGTPLLFVDSGRVVFDDVALREIPFQAENGDAHRTAWNMGPEARWFRDVTGTPDPALVGKSGTVSTRWFGLPIAEVAIRSPAPDDFELDTPGLEAAGKADGWQLWRNAGSEQAIPKTLRLRAAAREARLHNVAVAYHQAAPDVFRIGPFHFTEKTVPDASDYLDFTEEEYRQIARSPEHDKLKRRPKLKPLVGDDPDTAIWAAKHGRWHIRNGCVTGAGPQAVLRFWQELACRLEFRCRIRLHTEQSIAEIRVAADALTTGSGVRVASTPDGPVADQNLAQIRVPPDGEWHTLRLRLGGAGAQAQLDDQAPQHLSVERGVGGDVLLTVPAGTASFDDVELTVPRASNSEFFYAFDRRETDWWRHGEAAWVDHAGISCALASNWISLIAPAEKGCLWNKRTFAPDVLVSFNVEENSEWLGWRKRPTHLHFAYDNIQVLLSPDASPDNGYRLEINSRQRSATVLYRNGVEVAAVPQNSSFPLRYIGKHAPFAPRRNRIKLVKQGPKLQAFINGIEVLQFTDSNPVHVQRIGLGGYNTRINFSRLIVREL